MIETILNKDLLKNKNIIVGVTGSIAIYKSLELIRLFIKCGANVRVIMTKGAKKFITTLTFEALSSNKILDEESEEWSSDNNHISIGKWADIMIIAPATINTINKLSNGIADNLLTQTAIAYGRKIILAPSANTNMINSTITKASLKMLGICDYDIVESQTKTLACGDTGVGAMADIEQIFYKTCRELLKDNYWINRKVVISGGGSIEKIDDVRFISNFSSGKMANSLALSLYIKGAGVCFVSSKVLNLPSDIHVIEVQGSKEFKQYLDDSIRIAKKPILIKPTMTNDLSQSQTILKKPYLFMVSAISDYIPKYPQDGKIKKDMIGSDWSLELKENIDILSSLNKNDIYTVGFKAEMDVDNAIQNAKNSISKKNIDAVCLNVLKNSNSFGTTDNNIQIFTKDNKNIKFDTKDKILLSFDLVDFFSRIEN
jgi:phosphopantothenoylcysteine decarboxylase/phosphopantothenate--cysteine ligase